MVLGRIESLAFKGPKDPRDPAIVTAKPPGAIHKAMQYRDR